MIEQFTEICNFRSENPGTKGNGININNPLLSHVKNNLKILRQILADRYNNYRGFLHTVVSSEGQGNFPNVLHVCILPPNQKVSSGIYTGICFDIEGAGAVIGCMQSVTHSKGLETVIRKRRNKTPSINVDGGGKNTKYNNSFGNPKEFFVDMDDDSKMFIHLDKSIDLALHHLGLYDSDELNIAARIITNSNNEDQFNPKDINDGKRKIVAQIVARRGQRKFRNNLLHAYNFRCAITNDDLEQVLEAAHIVPYNGDGTNHIQNGLLLRSDIHTLFDLGLITIDASNYLIKIHPSLENSNYFIYNKRKPFLPSMKTKWPSKEALQYHNDETFLL